jgi:8-oxo-dGTP pyrophosphatase MutT (NUDIX family)
MTPRRSAGMSSDAPRRRGRTLREQSYGGVVVRGDPAELLAIVPRGRRQTLALPKGGGAKGETGEQTAVREVREETGVTATLRAPLGDVNYWYRRRGRTIYKTVTFFLLDYVEGSTEDHDHEVEEAVWLPLDKALESLSYPGERQMAALAARKLAEQGRER